MPIAIPDSGNWTLVTKEVTKNTSPKDFKERKEMLAVNCELNAEALELDLTTEDRRKGWKDKEGISKRLGKAFYEIVSDGQVYVTLKIGTSFVYFVQGMNKKNNAIKQRNRTEASAFYRMLADCIRKGDLDKEIQDAVAEQKELAKVRTKKAASSEPAAPVVTKEPETKEPETVQEVKAEPQEAAQETADNLEVPDFLKRS
jgi:hypothetical protein